MLNIKLVSYIILSMFILVSCGLPKAQYIQEIIPSPSGEKIIVVVSVGAPTIKPTQHIFVLPAEQKIQVLESLGRNISSQNKVLKVKSGEAVKLVWNSDASINVRHWAETDIQIKKKSIYGIVLNLTPMPDSSIVRQKVLKFCPSIVAGLQNKLMALQNGAVLPKTFEAEWLSQPTNYHDYVEKTSPGRDYFCNLSDKSGGVGWMIFVRINTENDSFTQDDLSPLFVEMRPTSNSEAGAMIWQKSQ